MRTVCIKWVTGFVFGLFGLIIFFLFLCSVFETSWIDLSESVSFHWDFPIFHILFLTGVCLAFPFLKKRPGKKIPAYLIYGICFLCMVLWVSATRLYPKADQLILMDRCKNIAENNFQDFLPGGYLYNQPHQIFLAFFSAALYAVFGRSYVFVFQGLNCLAMLGIFRSLSEIYRRFDEKGSRGTVLAAAFLFLPLPLYVTFV